MAVLEANKIYENLKQEIKKELKNLPTLTLASIRINKDTSNQIYILAQKKLAKELGINFILIDVKNNTLNKVLQKIDELNKDEKINGIIVNRPFPKKFKENIIFSTIDFRKDIEGLNPYNLGRLFLNDPLFISPTVLSILEFLRKTKVKLYGKKVTIVGFSILIGMPLVIILGKKFATINISHIATYEKGDLSFYVKNADILITAIGKPKLIKGNWIKKGAVVIDVGIAKNNGKILGDIEFEVAEKRASFITPVPGGVGKLTTLFLFKNLIKAYKYTKYECNYNSWSR